MSTKERNKQLYVAARHSTGCSQNDWAEICEQIGHSPEIRHEIPDVELREWRLKFLSAIKNPSSNLGECEK